MRRQRGPEEQPVLWFRYQDYKFLPNGTITGAGEPRRYILESEEHHIGLFRDFLAIEDRETCLDFLQRWGPLFDCDDWYDDSRKPVSCVISTDMTRVARAIRWLGIEFLPSLLPMPDLARLREFLCIWPYSSDDPAVTHSIDQGRANASQIFSRHWSDSRSHLIAFAPTDLQHPPWRFNDFAKESTTSDMGFMCRSPIGELITAETISFYATWWLKAIVQYFVDDIRYDIRLNTGGSKDQPVFSFEPVSVLRTPWSVLGWMLLKRVTNTTDVDICPNPNCRDVFVKKRAHAETCDKAGCQSWNYRRKRKQASTEKKGGK